VYNQAAFLILFLTVSMINLPFSYYLELTGQVGAAWPRIAEEEEKLMVF
jgi:hypothetical protein